jgi:NitT/TauT family transport system permease protein
MDGTVQTMQLSETRGAQALRASGRGLGNFLGGLAILLALWYVGVEIIASDPSKAGFADFGPIPAFNAFPRLWEEGILQDAVTASGYRLGVGLLIAIAIGVPIGIILGSSRRFREVANAPFQFLRMVSPMSWEPIAVLVFGLAGATVIFLVSIGAVWPIVFATAAGLTKVDPAWFKVARNLGASRWNMLTQIIIPAIAYDVLTGIRLALGVAWIILVPAEFLGVSDGLGYAVQDAKESLSYDSLMAMILVIGAIGYLLDSACVLALKRYSWHKA